LLISLATLADEEEVGKFGVDSVSPHRNVAHAGATPRTSRGAGQGDYVTRWHGSTKSSKLTLSLSARVGGQRTTLQCVPAQRCVLVV